MSNQYRVGRSDKGYTIVHIATGTAIETGLDIGDFDRVSAMVDRMNESK